MFVQSCDFSDAISIPPPSISSSSLLIHGKSGKDFTVNNSKGWLQQLAVVNMSSKFHTTPDSAFYTPKTILKNAVNGLEELMESRMRSTLLQLAQKSAEHGVQNRMQQLLFKLLAPSQKPLRIATVLTQFVSSEQNYQDNVNDTYNDLVKLDLEFKATIEVVIFGDVTTVEMYVNPFLICSHFISFYGDPHALHFSLLNRRGPVVITAKFDSSDNLLNAVDIKFDCEILLKSMVSLNPIGIFFTSCADFFSVPDR